MLPNIYGRVAWRFTEDNYDTDNILGPAYISETDIGRLQDACMASVDPDFATSVKPGDVLIGGENFGYGHAHFSPLIAMRSLGIRAVIAESFYPDFLRAETENGMPLLEVHGIVDATRRWDRIRVEWDSSCVVVEERRRLPFAPLSQHSIELMECGGLLGYLEKHRGRSSKE